MNHKLKDKRQKDKIKRKIADPRKENQFKKMCFISELKIVPEIGNAEAKGEGEDKEERGMKRKEKERGEGDLAAIMPSPPRP